MQEVSAGIEQSFQVNGDSVSHAMEAALSHRLPSFYRSAYRLLGNPADAEDAVQEALLCAYKHLDQFRGRAEMSTWLHAIVINSARMQLRRRPRQVHVSINARIGEEQEHSISEQIADRGPNPEDHCRSSELEAHLRHFVTQLSPTLRKTFQLRDLDGLSIGEIADILAVPIGTVKARLARARVKLKALMSRVLDAKRRSSQR